MRKCTWTIVPDTGCSQRSVSPPDRDLTQGQLQATSRRGPLPPLTHSGLLGVGSHLESNGTKANDCHSSTQKGQLTSFHFRKKKKRKEGRKPSHLRKEGSWAPLSLSETFSYFQF